jgi:chromosomal replication initiation ATPase DnaA
LAIALFATIDNQGKYDLDQAGATFALALDRLAKLRRKRARAKSIPDPRDIRWRSVVEPIAAEYGLTVEELRARRRSPHLVVARNEAIWRLRQLQPPMSYPEIARAVGLANHTSALHGFRVYAARLAREAENKAA